MGEAGWAAARGLRPGPGAAPSRSGHPVARRGDGVEAAWASGRRAAAARPLPPVGEEGARLRGLPPPPPPSAAPTAPRTTTMDSRTVRRFLGGGGGARMDGVRRMTATRRPPAARAVAKWAAAGAACPRLTPPMMAANRTDMTRPPV